MICKNIVIPTENKGNNFWFGTAYDTEEMECAGSKESGMLIPKSLKNKMTDVSVMFALSNALAAAEEHSGTVDGVLVRLYNDMRRTAVIEAVRYELVRRLNWRVVHGNPLGERTRPPLTYLENSMRNARRHAVQMMQVAE